MATPTELRNAVVNTFLGEVGYTSGSYTRSKYGYAKNWRSSWLGGIPEWQGMYCDRSYSWSFDQVLGAEAGRAAIGLQGYALPVGFAATWLHRAWFRDNGHHVGFANAQPGDAFLFKLPGRPKNPTNHIGMFLKWHVPGKVAITIEGNLPHPVIRTTSSIGVHLHYRDITYVVGVYRPDWTSAAAVYNKQHPPVDNEEFDMSAEQYATLKKQQDEILNVLNHHIRGNPTKAQKENAGTERDLPLKDLAWLTAGRVNSIRDRQWNVIKATDAVVKALAGRGMTVSADDRAAIEAALTARED